MNVNAASGLCRDTLTSSSCWKNNRFDFNMGPIPVNSVWAPFSYVGHVCQPGGEASTSVETKSSPLNNLLEVKRKYVV
jgi:hypothetical protein